MLQDLFTLRKNSDFLCIQPKKKKAAKPKKKAKKKKQEEEEEEEEEEGGENESFSEEFEGGNSKKDFDVRSVQSRRSMLSRKSRTSTRQHDEIKMSQVKVIMEKNASTVKYTPAPAVVENSVLVKLEPEPIKPPKPELKEAIPLEISYPQLMRYDWTLWFCRTKYQHALARLFKKANYKLHKELDICTIIRK